MVLSELKELLPLLKEHGVFLYKTSTLELHIQGGPLALGASVSGVDPLEGLKQQELSMPPDLRTDSIHDADKVLNWSSPDSQDLPLPLTGE